MGAWGHTPLWCAAREGHLPLVALLAEGAGALGSFTGNPAAVAASVPVRNEHGATPMFSTCEAGHLAVAQFLFRCAGEEGAPAPARQATARGYTPLYAAAYGGFIQVYRWLVGVFGWAPVR
jgi:hypothetical protein